MAGVVAVLLAKLLAVVPAMVPAGLPGFGSEVMRAIIQDRVARGLGPDMPGGL